MNRTSEQKGQEYRVSVTADSVSLKGNLVVPLGTQGIILFAHGSGSSRHAKIIISIIGKSTETVG